MGEGEWAVCVWGKGSGLFVCEGRGVGCLCVREGEWAVCVWGKGSGDCGYCGYCGE